MTRREGGLLVYVNLPIVVTGGALHTSRYYTPLHTPVHTCRPATRHTPLTGRLSRSWSLRETQDEQRVGTGIPILVSGQADRLLTRLPAQAGNELQIKSTPSGVHIHIIIINYPIHFIYFNEGILSGMRDGIIPQRMYEET